MLDYFYSTLPFHLALFTAAVSGLLSLLFIFLFFVSNLKARKEHASVPPSLPWMGTKPQIFSAIRANFRGLVDSVALYTQGYRKVLLLQGRQDICRTYVDERPPTYITPRPMGNWLASCPDAILNAKDCTFETAQFTYTVGHPEITSNDMIDLLIKRELTRTIGTLNNELLEEIEGSMDGIFGTDGEWREVGVFDSLTRTVGRVANCVFVGKELCSNMDFVMAGTHFARDISVSSYILHLFPKFMKPAVAWFATMPNRRHSGVAMKYLKPLIKERIEDMKRKEADPTYAWEEPNDFITWMVRESFKRNTEDETSVYALAYRVVLLNFAAITTTTIMSTNALLDIWSAPNSEELVAALREEAERVLHEHNGEWTKAAVAKLHRLDSAIRESARISGRRRHRDGPTRAHGQRSMRSGSPARARSRGYGEKPHTNEDLITTSVHWLPFSHGIHACPGRFFAANNIKMILAQILLNYDIQPFPSRPPNISLGDISVVPVKAKMMIRRRNVKA
ncbi:cytochrome P450 [Mycena olivaceomarginata]|nr:cytochrome P450 [Mycena olivaceomarginata]